MDIKQFDHVMVDIETMGNESYSAIVSISGVEFDLDTGELGREFDINVSLQSCLEMGLVVNASTIEWWMNQNEPARQKLFIDPIHISIALQKFSNFITDGGNTQKLWGNSARFDLGLLTNAYKKCYLEIPWDIRNERCVRTLSSFAPEIKKRIQDEGISHNGIEDCKQQIRYCVETWNTLIRQNEN